MEKMDINDYVNHCYERELSADGPMAEFVQSFFYGEMDRDELLDNVKHCDISDKALMY